MLARCDTRTETFGKTLINVLRTRDTEVIGMKFIISTSILLPTSLHLYLSSPHLFTPHHSTSLYLSPPHSTSLHPSPLLSTFFAFSTIFFYSLVLFSPSFWYVVVRTCLKNAFNTQEKLCLLFPRLVASPPSTYPMSFAD